MKKFLAVLMCLAMMLSVLAGCNQGGTAINRGNEDGSTLSDEEWILGKWKWEINISETFEMIMGEAAEYFDLKGLSLTLYMTFDEDTCSIELDKDSAEEMLNDYVDRVAEGLESYIESVIEEEGLDMTVEEFYETQGITKDELVNTMKESMEPAMDTFEEVEDETEYRLGDGKIYTDDSDEYITYEMVDKNTMKLKDLVTEDADEEEIEQIEMILGIPATLKRVK